jgi:hypothetical protein
LHATRLKILTCMLAAIGPSVTPKRAQVHPHDFTKTRRKMVIISAS